MVRLDSRPVDRVDLRVADAARLEVMAQPRFVSRGADKLRGAFDVLGVSASGRVCLDAGASTGGFTDCLLASSEPRQSNPAGIWHRSLLLVETGRITKPGPIHFELSSQGIHLGDKRSDRRDFRARPCRDQRLECFADLIG